MLILYFDVETIALCFIKKEKNAVFFESRNLYLQFLAHYLQFSRYLQKPLVLHDFFDADSLFRVVFKHLGNQVSAFFASIKVESESR